MRRSILIRATALAGLLSVIGLPGSANAQEQPFPSRPIKLVVPYPPGAAIDNMARGFAQELAKKIKTPVVIENKPGAGTAIAALAVKSAPADGYTLMFQTENFLIAKLANPQLDYKATDFETITPLAKTSYTLIVPGQHNLRTLADLKAHAAKKGNELDLGSLGMGPSMYNVLGTALSRQLGVKANMVPYKGGMEALNAVMSGQIDGLFSTVSTSYIHKDNPRLHNLALASDGSRNPFFPDLPSFKDLGVKDVVFYSLFGLTIRADTPEAIKKTLKEATRQVADSEELKRFRRQISLEDYTGTLDKFNTDTKNTVEMLQRAYEHEQKR